MGAESKSLEQVWEEHYRGCASDTVLKDRNFFRMEVDALLRELVARTKGRPAGLRILELGSGTGFLAEAIVSALGREGICGIEYTGVDFSEEACSRATARGIQGCRFVPSDFLEFFSAPIHFDVIVSQRSIMAILDPVLQKELLMLAKAALLPRGLCLFSEGSSRGLAALTALRTSLGVATPFEKVWHSQYLDESLLCEVFPKLEIIEFCSAYWLITRVVYPYFEEPKHNTKLHDFAAGLAQDGPYGLVKLFVAEL